MKNIFLICLVLSITLSGTQAFASTTTTYTTADATSTLLASGLSAQEYCKVAAVAGLSRDGLRYSIRCINMSSLLINPINKGQPGGNILPGSLNFYYSWGRWPRGA